MKILGGLHEFVGKIGTIIGKEGNMYRVRLDEPVAVPGVGRAPDDLWEGRFLKKMRSSRGDAGNFAALSPQDLWRYAKSRLDSPRDLAAIRALRENPADAKAREHLIDRLQSYEKKL